MLRAQGSAEGFDKLMLQLTTWEGNLGRVGDERGRVHIPQLTTHFRRRLRVSDVARAQPELVAGSLPGRKPQGLKGRGLPAGRRQFIAR